MEKYYKFYILISCVILIVLLKFFNYIPYYAPAVENKTFITKGKHNDDSIRIAFIGDSWAEYHQHMHNCCIAALVCSQTNRPVSIRTCGISGLTSKQLYQYLFTKKSITDVIEWGPDFCIVAIGVNDADRKLGKHYYQENIRLIINFLLDRNIVPVVLEIPYFNTWHSFKVRKPFEKLKYLMSMIINFSAMDCIDEYRNTFEVLMEQQNWYEKLIYLKTYEWNQDGYRDTRDIYDDLQMHLNTRGYQILDSCIAQKINRYLYMRISVIPVHQLR